MKTKSRKHIVFYEANHTYLNSHTKEKYQSITSFINHFYPKFDSHNIATNLVYSNKKYIQKYLNWNKTDAILDLQIKWQKRAIIGKRIHKILEDYLQGKSILTESETWNKRIFQLIKAWDNLNLKHLFANCEFNPEMIVYSDKYKLAGQSDLIIINHQEKSFTIFDYKTNEKGITKKSFDDRYCFNPVEHLPDANFYHYSLQLNLYGCLLSQELNYRCEGHYLLWIDTNKVDRINIEIIKCDKLEEEIKLLLNTIKVNAT